MAFSATEYLKDGKVDFIYDLSQYDIEHLIDYIRKSPNRNEIINGFLPKINEYLDSFCFSVIYDIPEYADYVYNTFFKENAEWLVELDDITPFMLNNLLNNSPLGLKLLNENFDEFLSSKSKINYIDTVIKYAFDSNNRDLIHKISRYKDLHTRFIFMKYLINNYKEQIDSIYDDITKYTTSVTNEQYEQTTFLPDLMDSEDISKLAVLLLEINRESDYEKLKDFIFNNYKYNYLASELISLRLNNDDSNKEKSVNAFNTDGDILFKTSADYRYPIYLKYSANISQELLDDFASRIKYFFEKENDLYLTYRIGLGQLLEEWSQKYMDLSKNKDYGFIGGGTTCDCFRIGDYVIKLVKMKWSYEDEICPNIYLIAKNYEEIYLRDNKGIVNGGLEVQKYLTRKATDIDPKYFRYFDNALDRLGYRRTDTLTGGKCGENSMLLDTYRDADCDNPERVPVWFKICPLVLIDRDRIYPKNKCYIKQLSSRY